MKKTLSLSFAVVGLIALFGGRPRAQLLTQKAEDVRFQLVTNEPIAAPDNRSVVAGWSAIVLRDRHTGKCFVAVTEGESMSLSPVECR